MNRFLKFVVALLMLNISLPASSAVPILKPNTTVMVTEAWNLNGGNVRIPQGVTLSFNGGYIFNGTLTGTDTAVDGCLLNIFGEGIIIAGTWNVSEISTDMFSVLDYENSLKNVFALSSAKCYNHILIEEGDYSVNVANAWTAALTVNSNSDVEMNGVIRLIPNSHSGCQVFNVIGDNITLKGKGTVFGDRAGHLGKDGEWGMGINLNKCNNVLVSGLTIKDCWGDCIYVAGESERVSISNCRISGGRRQGISITSARKVTIKGCEISEIRGVDPQRGIDLEPNKDNTVSDVLIEDVFIHDCSGGLLFYCGAKNASLFDIQVRNCTIVDTTADNPVAMYYANNCHFVGNSIESGARKPIFRNGCKKLYLVGNTFLSDSNVLFNNSNEVEMSGNKFVTGMSAFRRSSKFKSRLKAR